MASTRADPVDPTVPGLRDVRRRLPYLPALDGLRGVAVTAVLLFHSDFSWASGGHLGVTAFFTLSGFLITGLLLLERESTGTIAFRAFWVRRARRLVPAMLVCFGLIAAVIALMETRPNSGIIGDAVGGATWTANWRFIFAERTYADLFSSPSPFQHFWSLAVEEQFYVLFPLVVGACTARRFLGSRRWPLGVLLSAGIVASTLQAARLHEPDGAIARAYYGTDARIAEILVGALLALFLVGPKGVRVLPPAWRHVTSAVGVAGAAGLAFAFVTLGDRDDLLYEGGFLAVALCTAAAIATISQPGSPLGRVLAAEPLARLGRISYGVYLFHWPLFILLDERSTGLDGATLFGWRAAATLGLAASSYALLESPVRRARLSPSIAGVGWANAAVAAVAVIAIVSTQVPDAGPGRVAAAATAPDPAGAGPDAKRGPDGAAPSVGSAGMPAPADSAAGARPTSPTAPPPTAPRAGGQQVPDAFAGDPEDAPVPPPPGAAPDKLRIAMVGDSIGVNLGRGLEIWASERTDVVVYNAALTGCPISRGGERRFGDGDPRAVSPACGWWDDPFAKRYSAFAEFGPDIVIVQDGINEVLDRRLEEWGEFRRAGDPRFDGWLRQEYDDAVSSWAAQFGAAVVMTNAPCGDWDRYELTRQVTDADLRTRALNTSVYPGVRDVTVADLFERVCPGGTFQSDVEGVPDGRPDGFHFSDEAAAALARNWLGPLILEASDGWELLPPG